MRHLVSEIADSTMLLDFLDSPENREAYQDASSVLIQLYGSALSAADWAAYIKLIQEKWPQAEIIGGNSSGEIISGRSFSGTVFISALCFQYSFITLFDAPCDNSSLMQTTEAFKLWFGKLRGVEAQLGEKLRAVQILTAPIAFKVSLFIEEISQTLSDVLVFGGGLGHCNHGNLMVNRSGGHLEGGITAVAYFGDHLEVNALSHLGWKAFSQTMTITKAETNKVLEVDGKPAFELYHKYLNIENDQNFEVHTRSFPFLVNRGNYCLARVPVSVEADGALRFYSSVLQGDTFRIGYADPHSMLSSARDLQDQMAAFEPQGVLLFSCDSRIALLGTEVDLETYPFDLAAPTAGLYTVGEYCGSIGGLASLNSAFVAIGFKERSAEASEHCHESSEGEAYKQWRMGFTDQLIKEKIKVRDPHAVARLVQFITVVTQELEATNLALEQLSSIDKLTQLYNRMKLDEIMSHEIGRAGHYGSTFSIIMLDVDYFKRINDQYGHLTGDQILIEVSQLLKSCLNRKSDLLGRWGGEEFLAILPENELDQAIQLAVKLKRAIASHVFAEGISMTCSFGVTTYHAGDTEDQMLDRADQALLKAKALGRNRVEFEAV